MIKYRCATELSIPSIKICGGQLGSDLQWRIRKTKLNTKYISGMIKNSKFSVNSNKYFDETRF